MRISNMANYALAVNLGSQHTDVPNSGKTLLQAAHFWATKHASILKKQIEISKNGYTCFEIFILYSLT